MNLEIERLGGLGDGVGKHNGKTVVVPFSLPGDQVRVSIVSENSKRILASIEEIISPSEFRVAPPCRHFGACGGCQLQHVESGFYRTYKESILRHTLSRAGFEPDIVATAVDVGPRSRRRTLAHCRFRNGELQIGYYRHKSRDLVVIEECPQVTEQIEDSLKRLGRLLSGMTHADAISKVQVTEVDQGLDVVVHWGLHPDAGEMQHLSAIARREGYARIGYVYKDQYRPAFEAETITVNLGGVSSVYPAMGFLQASQAGQEALIENACSQLENSTSIADLYAGCGTYTLPLLRQGHKVTAFEGNGESVSALVESIKTNGWLTRGTAVERDIFKEPVRGAELRGFDAVVINPPRNGAEPQIEALSAGAVPRIVMISCYPISLERDLRILRTAGFEVEAALPIDQFHWTPHLESLLVLSRE